MVVAAKVPVRMTVDEFLKWDSEDGYRYELVDGEPRSGCLTLAPQVEGREVTTVEGLGGADPVQRAFIAVHGFQCGWCTPGFVLTTKALLAENPQPSEAEIAEALSGNLCRCGSYVKIVDAVRRAAAELAGTP